MKTEFDDDGTLMIRAENNTEMVALKAWYADYHEKSGKSVIGFEFDSHLKVQTNQALS